MPDGLHIDIGRRGPSLDATVGLFIDIVKDFLNRLALDAAVFDLSQVDVRPFLIFPLEPVLYII